VSFILVDTTSGAGVAYLSMSSQITVPNFQLGSCFVYQWKVSCRVFLLGVSILPLFTMFLLDFQIVPTVLFCVFHFFALVILLFVLLRIITSDS
jgi:hypothetical protein